MYFNYKQYPFTNKFVYPISLKFKLPRLIKNVSRQSLRLTLTLKSKLCNKCIHFSMNNCFIIFILCA